MPNSIPPSIPNDMRDLLIRLDTKVDMGFDNISKQLNKIEDKQSTHETEINSLKDRMKAVETSRTEMIPEYKQHVETIKESERRLDKAEGGLKVGHWGFGLLVAIVLAIVAQIWSDHRARAELEQRVYSQSVR